ncbi:replication initiator protein A [uncultured Paraglaciecola sp.]|uniref:replication initiator protein A n=1 Tax=uncultured Paraglaciecola sp. TaxID=1765024 RepID=UPI002638938C|nr:replication initiator protein A [uncultured Paraglaciecola sp.]
MTVNQLLPEKYPTPDLFICDVADAVLKDIMPQMEHPFYALSKKPETNIRRYEHNGNWLEITPSVKGLATIYDKDVLIYAISQIMAKLNRGERVDRRIRINCHELLMFTNRGTSGKDYSALCEAVDRLAGTRISTNITAGDEEEYNNFGLIDQGSIRRKNGLNGRLLWLELTISDWVFDAIRNNAVLTLNRDYFRLRKPLERRIYEIARKHCGQQKQWPVSLELLHKKSGSQSPVKKFRLIIKNIVKHDHLPDYLIEYNEHTDQVTFKNRTQWWKDKKRPERRPFFRNADTHEKAKAIIPRGEDVYAWESDWVNYWIDTDCPPLKDPDAAFLGFCKGREAKKRQERLL